MQVKVRAYKSEEFDQACQIRGLDNPTSIEKFRNRFQYSGEWVDHFLHLAIECDGELVGDIQFRYCQQMMPSGAWHMGIELAPEARGKGIGTIALKLLREWAFSHGAHRVEGSTAHDNYAMRGAFEKAGWNFEGVLKKLFMEDGKGVDYYSFATTQ